jgi:hypothetical protein
MRPTTTFDDNVFNINALLHPGTIFDHPRDVLAHPSCRFQNNAPSWRPGLPMRRRSLPAPRCGQRRASRHPSPSTRSWKPCANSTAAPAIRLAASRPPALNVETHGGIARSSTMEEIRLPQHVRNRIERRWAVRFARMLGSWRRFERRAFAFRPKLRSAPIVASSAAAQGVPETADGR